MNKRRKVAYAVLIIIALFLLWWLLKTPSNDRDWLPYQAIPATATVNGNIIQIDNVRNVTWYNTTEYTLAYYNATYNLTDLDAMWFIVEPISDWQGAAHTFFTFRFKDQYIAISVEARRTPEESFSATGGLMNNYELFYVIANEQDAIYLRGAKRKHDVYLYPINTNTNNMQTLFLAMLARANALQEKPEFYNTLWNSCTTNLVDHVNEISPKRVPFSTKYLAPGYADSLAYELNLIDTQLPYEEIREHYNISDKILSYDGTSDFSAWIRK